MGHVHGGGHRAVEVERSDATTRQVGTPRDWQEVLNDAASIRLLRRDVEDAGVELYQVTHRDRVVRCYLVDGPVPTGAEAG